MAGLREILATFVIKVDGLKSLMAADAAVGRSVKSFAASTAATLGTAVALGKFAKQSKDFAGEVGASGGILAFLFKYRLGMLQLAEAAGVATALKRITEVTIDQADALGKAAARVGVTTKEYQLLQAVSDSAGTSVETIGVALRGLLVNADEAARGGKDASAAFKELGVNVKDSKGQLRPTADLLLEVGGKLGDVENNAKRVALAQHLMGRAGYELLPAFKGGSKAAEAQRKQLAELAEVYDTALVGAAEKYKDTLKRIELAQKSLAGVLTKDTLPWLQRLRDFQERLTRQFVNWAKQINFVRLALTFLTGGVLKLATVFGRAIFGLGGAAARTGLLYRALRALIPVLRFVAVQLARLLIPLLIVDDVIGTLEGADSILRRIVDGLFGVGATADAVQFLSTALASVWESIKLIAALIRGDIGIDEFTEKFLDASQFIGDAFDNLFASIGEGFANLLIWLGHKAKAIPGMLVEGVSGWARSLFGGVDPNSSFSQSLTGIAADRERASMPMPGGLREPTRAEQSANMSISGDRNITINMTPGASPKQVADRVGVELDRDRAATLAAVQ
jgi:hypothetical protein